MSAYDSILQYRPGVQLQNVDAFSRLLLQTKNVGVPDSTDVLLLEMLDPVPIKATEIAAKTSKDRILSTIMYWALNGWPDKKPDIEFRSYFDKK